MYNSSSPSTLSPSSFCCDDNDGVVDADDADDADDDAFCILGVLGFCRLSRSNNSRNDVVAFNFLT